MFEPGPTPPGTRFELRIRDRGRGYRKQSRAWLGRLRAVASPTLDGTIAVGSTVRARPARWRGGWREPGAFSELRIEACRTLKSLECETLAAPSALSGGKPEARIGRYYAGWYVQAIDWRHAEDTVFELPAYGDALAVPPIRRFGGGVAVSAPARVPGAPADVPRVKLRKRAELDRGRLVIGEAKCGRCSIELLGTVGTSEFQQTIHVRRAAALQFERPGGSARMAISVQVHIDGRRLLSGTVAGTGKMDGR